MRPRTAWRRCQGSGWSLLVASLKLFNRHTTCRELGTKKVRLAARAGGLQAPDVPIWLVSSLRGIGAPLKNWAHLGVVEEWTGRMKMPREVEAGIY